MTIENMQMRFQEGATRVNAAWAKTWLFFFLLNEDYEKYCVAKRTKDNKTAKVLEKQFPKVAELYEDWGDIHQMQLRDWWSSHKHLFFTDTSEVREVTSSHEIKNTSLYLEIPLDMPVSKATEAALAIIRTRFKSDSTKPNKGKYSLALKTISFRSWGSLMTRLHAWELAKTGTHTNTSLVYQLQEDLKVWDSEYADFEVVDFMHRLTSVKRFKRDAKNIIANTIYGKFPVKTPPK